MDVETEPTVVAETASSPTVVICEIMHPPLVTSADVLGIADNGPNTTRWICKKENAALSLAEWVCGSLARSLELPIPQFSPVALRGAETIVYFGSQLATVVVDAGTALSGSIVNADVFRKTYAFDNFVHNIDRHSHNFLYLNLDSGIVANLIDHSRAFTALGWPLATLPLPHCHTLTYRDRFFAKDPNGSGLGAPFLDKIEALPEGWMKGILDSAPKEWLVGDFSNHLDSWWRNGQRHERIAKAREVLR